ncbi:MAG: cytidylate kinase-like family protein [Acidobacteriota bacterium]|nr:cytidylate kinase-like family protein [Acidobacteriota bacterium]
MFKIIAVEREYGAGGSLVAAELARRKGWQLLDQQLTCEIAKLASVDEKAVARHSEKCDPLMYRLARVFWRGSHERSLAVSDDKFFDTDEMVALAYQIIEQKGKEGNCVIVGRGAPYILRHRVDTFRVFVYGSREEKIRRLVRLKMDPKESEETVDTIDAERAAFVRKYFNAEWPSRHLYHMLLNSDPGIEYATETVLATMDSLEQLGARATSIRHTALDPIQRPSI